MPQGSSGSASLCVEVGKGGVGESGAFSQVVHQVESRISKMMVLRHVDSNLCPDHGAVAVLTVDGKIEASGLLTDAGSSIQAEAGPNAWVVASVSLLPLFNGIVCVELGELRFRLDECDLE